MRFFLLSLSCLIVVSVASQPGHCDQYCDYGFQLYNQRRFDQAKKYFEQSLKLSPKNDRSHFYRGVCCEYLNNVEEAKTEYQYITANSSDTKLIALAKASLERINKAQEEKESKDADTDTAKAKSSSDSSKKATSPDKNKISMLKSQKPNSSTAPDNDDDKDDAEVESLRQAALVRVNPTDVVPPETRVYFTQSGHDDISINAKVSGRDLRMILDTGAAVTLLGKNQLEELHVKGPSGNPTGYVGGVGGSSVPTWNLPIQIELGNLKKTVNARIADEWTGSPLLGQDFFNNIEYEIDNKGHCIYFRRPKVISQKDRDAYCVPFTRLGRHLLVTVEVEGGRKTGMIVDTGAEGICLTMANMKELNMEIPADAQRIRSQGVGGTADGFAFSIENLRLGPIVQRGVAINVTTSAGGMLGTDEGRYGLLGQGFFGNWRFTVDNANGVLRFFH